MTLYLLLIAGTAILAQNNCPSIPTTKKANQDRTVAKHETNYSHFKKKKDTISVDYIYNWQAKYDSKTSLITTTVGKPTTLREHGTPEDSLYILKGYLWLVRMEENDCDFHMEIGPADSAGTRVVVEVPQENTTAQTKIRNEMNKRQLHIENCKPGTSKGYHFKTGIPVVITGLGFYDASHKPNTNHGDDHTKIYSWELHPVKAIVFLKK